MFLLIDSPGGRVDSSYKVALAIREFFKDIIVFIPRVAASGGTLVALVGNKIVMSDMAIFSLIRALILDNLTRPRFEPYY